MKSLYGLALVVALPAASAAAFEGRVVLDGDPPPAQAPHEVKIDREACGGDTVPNESFVMSPDKGVANVVVSVVNAPKTDTVRSDEALLDQKACRFVPHVLGVQLGQPIQATNTDPVLHNAHAISTKNKSTMFNIAFPIKGQKLPIKPKKPGIYTVRCDAGHTWMNAYVHVFKHPYFAVTDEDGNFDIPNLPDGTYQLRLWHETLGQRTVEVVVDSAREGTPVALELKVPKS